jgi:predicted metalloprotease with PDZ domain
MLGALLDLAIRHSTGNAKSLDDVMRALYRTYYQGKKRGFTDAEFRAACESAAGGASLAEVFDYAATTKQMDYAKYFAWAGLAVTATATDGKGLWIGANLQSRDTGLLVTDVVPASPAAGAGLRPDDLIIAVDGTSKPTVKLLSDTLAAKKTGDTVTLKVTNSITLRPAEQELRVQPFTTPQWTYAIQPLPTPTAEQKLIADAWLGK